MKKIAIAVLAIVIIAAGAFAAMQFIGGPAETAVAAETPESETVAEVSPQRIVVDAKVVPARQADLSLASAGIVAEMLVAEGDSVEIGQTLLKLESAREQAAVTQAQAQLSRVKAQLAESQAGARDQEITSSEATLEGAQARLDRIVNGPIAEDIAASEAALAEAQASLQKVLEGPTREELIAAQTEVANADAKRRQAQAAYDRVSHNNDIGSRPESVDLEQATNSLTAAQARLDDLNRGASNADIAAARARVRQAQSQLDALQAQNPADVAGAQAEVRQAKAQLELLQAGTRSETIDALAADVAAAEAALEQAIVALNERELRAPFAGTVAALDTNVGEQVSVGSAVVRLADLTSWEIETEDLTEFDAVQLETGMPATIAFDAISDLELDGAIKFIRPIGEDLRGDTVYTVVITPNQSDDRLLWNLTAVVTIEPK